MDLSPKECPQPQMQASGLGSFHFARRYFGNRGFFLFLRVLRCFSSPGSLLHTYVFSMGYLSITSGAFPHSDIRGSTVVCTSPQLFAAYHVLLRLLLPRHSPCALLCLTLRLSLPAPAALRFAFCGAHVHQYAPLLARRAPWLSKPVLRNNLSFCSVRSFQNYLVLFELMKL